MLLWVGREDEKLKPQKEGFIKALVEFEDDCGEWKAGKVKGVYKYRAYFLAAVLMAEFKDCSLSNAIVDQIVMWSSVYFNYEKLEWWKLLDPIVEGAREVMKEKEKPRAIATLVEIIRTSQNEYILMQAANSLGEIDKDNAVAIAALVEIIRTSQNEYILMQAAESLGKIGKDNTVAIAALVEIIRTSQYEFTLLEVAATESLGKIGKDNPVAIASLVELIGTSQYELTRRQAAESLGKILTLPQQIAGVVTALKDYLSDETYNNDFDRLNNCYKVLWHCAQSLPYPTFYEAWHYPPTTPTTITKTELTHD
ncbi:HEAT repeat domain-containing protein [Kamptonema sp. UHCC 0994]|uniref:HEAT repeat domain-containing protein n=1 Tax=Kamptonema sp. UHCC 0994 TaxID=3031329 RepID=UPI0023BA5B47|nr:HEAT repeat domain-containing protein [Kamptonema sp. UHCC 0994]MDF0556499.1 HEAT repeat domain-containing protein [Kamptonema sp. UHCC 0994]